MGLYHGKKTYKNIVEWMAGINLDEQKSHDCTILLVLDSWKSRGLADTVRSTH